VLALVVEAGFDPKGTTDWEVQLPNGESFGLIAGPVKVVEEVPAPLKAATKKAETAAKKATPAPAAKVPSATCKTVKQLEEEFQATVKQGGEKSQAEAAS
jgi:hypothetical protein